MCTRKVIEKEFNFLFKLDLEANDFLGIPGKKF